MIHATIVSPEPSLFATDQVIAFSFCCYSVAYQSCKQFAYTVYERDSSTVAWIVTTVTFFKYGQIIDRPQSLGTYPDFRITLKEFVSTSTKFLPEYLNNSGKTPSVPAAFPI